MRCRRASLESDTRKVKFLFPTKGLNDFSFNALALAGNVGTFAFFCERGEWGGGLGMSWWARWERWGGAAWIEYAQSVSSVCRQAIIESMVSELRDALLLEEIRPGDGQGALLLKPHTH